MAPTRGASKRTVTTRRLRSRSSSKRQDKDNLTTDLQPKARQTRQAPQERNSAGKTQPSSKNVKLSRASRKRGNVDLEGKPRVGRPSRRAKIDDVEVPVKTARSSPTTSKCTEKKLVSTVLTTNPRLLRRSTRSASRTAQLKIEPSAKVKTKKSVKTTGRTVTTRAKERQREGKETENTRPLRRMSSNKENVQSATNKTASSRKTVSKKATSARQTKAKKQTGLDRTFEEKLWKKGMKVIVGVDEAGRGPLGGPVVAAACSIPEHVHFEGIDDSKKLNEELREKLFEQITNHNDVQYSICRIDEGKIDEINILQASLLAMTNAVNNLKERPDYTFIDGPYVPKGLAKSNIEAVVRGDSKVYSISAASILAKVTRDRIMVEYDKQYPEYGFAQHKGYPTLKHRTALMEHGPCPIHRMTFGPVKKAMLARESEDS